MQDLKQPPDLDPTGPALTVSTVPPVVRECQTLRDRVAKLERISARWSEALHEIQHAGSAEYARRRAELALEVLP